MKSDMNFEQIAKGRHEASFIVELWTLLRNKKKYWLMPIVVMLLLFGVLVFLSGTAAAPFIYTLF
jgi:drug/metabolite transporter superfamily protein YnfA